MLVLYNLATVPRDDLSPEAARLSAPRTCRRGAMCFKREVVSAALVQRDLPKAKIVTMLECSFAFAPVPMLPCRILRRDGVFQPRQ